MRISCTVKAINHEKDFESLELAEMWIQTSPEGYRISRVAMDQETYTMTLFVPLSKSNIRRRQGYEPERRKTNSLSCTNCKG